MGGSKEGRKKVKEERREEWKRKTEFSSVLEPAKFDHLFPHPHSGMLHWWLEREHGGSTFTTNQGSC